MKCRSALARSIELFRNTVFKKKLYAARPDSTPAVTVDTYRTTKRSRVEPCDSRSIERGVRQLLANKVSGTLMGVWLLIPEHLRLGTWDLILGWSDHLGERIEPRLALQLVHEAALCVSGVRQSRSLSQKGFEIANGLPFVASDQAIHNLLDAHTIADSQALQIALGQIRRSYGHYKARLLAIDPHLLRSHSKRQMVRRKGKKESRPEKKTQTFFCLDVETEQPVAFTISSSARTVTQATPELLCLAESILHPSDSSPMVLADTEHFTVSLFEHVHQKTPFDLMVPAPRQESPYKKLAELDPDTFTPRWAGFSTASQPYQFANSDVGFHQIIQRCGERSDDYRYKAFVATCLGDEVEALSVNYPQRWHAEEFFNTHQNLGWKRAGTQNLHIRYGRMSMALLAQSSLHGLRQRLGSPFNKWEASHLANRFLEGLDGDLRACDETILVTFYNAPKQDLLRHQYENLPKKLEQEGVNPRIPWLYNYKLDFRFR